MTTRSPRRPSRGQWAPPPAAPRLGAAELHLWRASLAPGAGAIEELAGLLSLDERERAARFVFARDRDRFVVARARLRQILGSYLSTDPRRLRFAYGAFGKPALEGLAGGHQISFNLSHSGELALYALTSGPRVGVDVELVRQNLEYAALLTDVFSPPERQAIAELPEELRCEAFFRGWVCKEAYIKASGEGLSCPPVSVGVSLLPGDTAALRLPASETAPWQLHIINPGPGYASAVVVEGRAVTVCCFDFAGDAPAT